MKTELISNLKNISIEGLANYPKDAPSVIITNHNRLMDIFYVSALLEDYIVSLISARLVYKNDPDRLKAVNKYLKAFPIEAHGGSTYSNICLKYASQILQSGISVNIFPEGAYLDEKDTVYRGRTGAARILFNCLEENKFAYFLPVAININSKSDLDSYKLDFADEVELKILEPIVATEYCYNYLNGSNMNEKNQVLHEMTDFCMQEIARALNRKYVNEYIQLRPKGNVIFSDGSTIDVTSAQDKKHVDRYEKDIKEKTLTLIKERI